MSGHQGHRPGSRQLGGLDMGSSGQCDHLAPNDAGVVGPPHDRHRDQRVEQTWSECGDYRDRQHRCGQCEESVGDAHEHGIDAATSGAGDESDEPADD
jgi:hypothetical protein